VLPPIQPSSPVPEWSLGLTSPGGGLGRLRGPCDAKTRRPSRFLVLAFPIVGRSSRR
jgi:hypothetical protein